MADRHNIAAGMKESIKDREETGSENMQVNG